MIRELTDKELDAVSGGILNFFTIQVNSNRTRQSNVNLVNFLSIAPQTNANGTLQINA